MTVITEDRVFARHPRRRGAVLIVGAGAVGSAIAVMLARAGFSPSYILDFDTLEVENIIHNEAGAQDVGQLKVKALTDRIRRDLLLCQAFGIDGDFLKISESALLGLVGAVDIVVAATDDVDCQRRINEICLLARVPAVFPGVWVSDQLPTGQVGEILWMRPGHGMPCYLCATISRSPNHNARAQGGSYHDLRVLAYATVPVVIALCNPEDDWESFLDPRRNLMLVQAFAPSSPELWDIFRSTGASYKRLPVPLPPTPCPACGASRPQAPGRLPSPRRQDTGGQPVLRAASPGTPRSSSPPDTGMRRPAPVTPRPAPVTPSATRSSPAASPRPRPGTKHDKKKKKLAAAKRRRQDNALIVGCLLIVLAATGLGLWLAVSLSDRSNVIDINVPVPTAATDPEAPPTTDPGQSPLPAGAITLGAPDLQSYCQRGWGVDATLRYENAWGWSCGNGASYQPISVDDACAQQYGAGAFSHYREYADPHSWECLRG